MRLGLLDKDEACTRPDLEFNIRDVPYERNNDVSHMTALKRMWVQVRVRIRVRVMIALRVRARVLD